MKPDLNRSIEDLEGKIYPVETGYTNLVFRVTSLRKKPIGKFNIEELRVCISQNEGLPFLIPQAIERLKKNILAEGDFYDGDLLRAVLLSDKSFWLHNRTAWKEMIILCEKNIGRIEGSSFGKELLRLYESFKQINTSD